MPLTPQDVRAKQFNPSGLVRKGYDEGEVDEFLDEVVAALEERDATIVTLAEKAAVQPTAESSANRDSVNLDSVNLDLIYRDADSGGTAERSSPEHAVALLAMAQRTAEEHINAGAAAAAQAREEAAREAAELTAAAEAEARRLLSDIESQRRRLLTDLHDEQRELHTEIDVLRSAAERSREHLLSYLEEALSTVQRSVEPPHVPELTALSA